MMIDSSDIFGFIGFTETFHHDQALDVLLIGNIEAGSKATGTRSAHVRCM